MAAGQLCFLPPRWVLLSFLAHVLIIACAKGLPAPQAPPVRLEVRLMPHQSAPVLPPAPARVAPAPTRTPERAQRPESAQRPILVRQDAPAATPVVPVAPPAISTAVPVAAPAPAAAGPAPAVPPVVPARADEGVALRNDLAGYGATFSRWLARHKVYPRIAQVRGWQGQVRLRVHVARKGAVMEVEVTRSSGFDVLDQEAVDMVRRATPLPDLPLSLAGSEFNLEIPIVFRLEQG